MIIIIMGPPCSGKGTQCRIISKKYNMVHISTGDIIRQNIHQRTKLGVISEDYINKGMLVPDEVIAKLVEEYLNSFKSNRFNILLDGYPRTIFQAEHLNDYSKKNDVEIKLVINLKVKDKTIISRVTLRLICPNKSCGEIYNLQNKSLCSMEICKVCGTPLVKREDDKEDVIKERLNVYNAQTKPLIDYYKKSDLLCNVNGEKKICIVTENIQKLFKKKKIN